MEPTTRKDVKVVKNMVDINLPNNWLEGHCWIINHSILPYFLLQGTHFFRYHVILDENNALYVAGGIITSQINFEGFHQQNIRI